MEFFEKEYGVTFVDHKTGKTRKYTMPKNGSYTKKQRLSVYNKTNGSCAYCGCVLNFEHFTIDHILPSSKGGKSKLKNLFPACKKCNNEKANFTIKQYRNLLKEHLIHLFTLKYMCGEISEVPRKVKLNFHFEVN